VIAVAVACSGQSSRRTGPDKDEVFRGFVHAWIASEPELLDTITGPEASRLSSILQALKKGEVVRATLDSTSLVPDRPSYLDGVVHLHFADGARLELESRVEVEEGRVLAAPAAISRDLTDWSTLRVERFGLPGRRGAILSRDGTVLARGPLQRRRLAREEVRPAVELIDESLNARLAGKAGYRLLAEEPPAILAEVNPGDGADVTTSLDDSLQAAGEEVFAGTPGAIVAVDPTTAGIRALVSNPDPNAPARSPASTAYSPGSTFKLVTAAAALEESVFELHDVVPCPARMSVEDRLISNFRDLDYGPITFTKAFSVSCNTAFARIGLTVGADGLLKMASRLGVRVALTVQPGAIAIPRSQGELAVWSFGAAGSLVTPLQMAGITATVARAGSYVGPRWVDEATQGVAAFRASTAGKLVTIMEEVVRSGTGERAAVPEATIAGKTGTAETEVATPTSDAWFIALAPSRDTRVVIVTFVPRGGIGGGIAASLTKDFLEVTSLEWNTGR
jgi:peptidoglycan glycosyltransferase